jgi:hypothetical protein
MLGGHPLHVLCMAHTLAAIYTMPYHIHRYYTRVATHAPSAHEQHMRAAVAAQAGAQGVSPSGATLPVTCMHATRHKNATPVPMLRRCAL